jgi:hypothetical protein
LKKQPPRIELNPREPATPGTIGEVFDYYRSQGADKLPDNATINSNNFKSKKS